MYVPQPDFWLIYVPASTEDGACEVAAVSPQFYPSGRVGPDADFVLGMACSLHDEYPDRRVVFFGELTRWLADDGFEWEHFDLDVDEVLDDLDRLPPILIEASHLAMAVVANTALRSEIFFSDGSSDVLERHIEPARAALAQFLATFEPVVDHR